MDIFDAPSEGLDTAATWQQWLTPEPEALALVSRSLAWESGILPIKFHDGKFIVATVAPVSSERLSHFQIAVQRQILYFEAPREYFQEAMFRVYGQVKLPELDKLVEAVTVNQKRAVEPPIPDVDHTTHATQIIGITSGKGGTGKSTLTANLGVALASLGYRVGMIDADFGLANLHLILGINPERTLADVASGAGAAVQTMAYGPVGVRVLCGSAGMHLMDYQKMHEIGADYDAFRGRFDFLLVDTAAGAHPSVVSMLERCDEVLVVMSAEPTSVHDAYVTAQAVLEQNPLARLSCLMNQVEDEGEAKMVYAKFQTVLKAHTGATVSLAGFVWDDDAVYDAGRTRQPYVIAAPRSRAAKDTVRLARRLAHLPEAHAVEQSLFKRLFKRKEATAF